MRTDLVADSLTMIRNGCRAKKDSVDIIKSNFNMVILELLKKEGYISNLKVLETQMPKRIRVYLKYDSQGESVILGLKRISRPGLKRYVGAKKIPRVLRGLGTAIISTSKGILSDKEAREKKAGGEVVLFVW